MKRSLFTLVFILFSTCLLAQDVALTKGETISYINKQLQKTVGFEYHAGSVVDRISLSETSRGLRFSYSASGSNKFAYNAYETPSWGGYDKCPDRQYDFDPIYVKNIYLKSTGRGSVRYLTLSFIKKELVKENIGGCSSTGLGRNQMVNEVLFFFTMVETKEYDRLKKAFEHLIALYKAEEDPFGE